MPRYKLTIAYDGTDFCGWQKQEPPAGMVAPDKVMGDAPPCADEPVESDAAASPDAAPAAPRPRVILRTVQEVVERAVREVVREPVMLTGASRTDAGVHARGQVAAFTCGPLTEPPAQAGGEATDPTTPHNHPRSGWPLSRGADRLILALNSRLPEDVLITAAEPVADSFNPISDCTAKGYSYTLHVSPHRPIWDRRFVRHIWSPLDIAAMNDAAARFVGEHDFAAFAAAGHGRVSTVRTVFECRVVEQSSGTAEQQSSRLAGAEPEWARRVRIEISGNGFLWNMVRIIAGTLVEVGRGRKSPADVTAAIESKDRRSAGPTLAATGLCLEWIRYDRA